VEPVVPAPDPGIDDFDDFDDPPPDPPVPVAPAKPPSSDSGSDSGGPPAPAAAPPPPRPPTTKAKRREAAAAAAAAASDAAVNPQLRSPICVIMGHVDTGKTKLLDKIRHTNVQDGEAGGITQQIGATYFPVSTLREMTRFLADKYKLEYKLPGLLIIDTPGHASFSNLRSRGSSLCDIAILVVDIMHGIEPQTKESIQMLRARKSMFIIALNKIDRLLDWKPSPNAPFTKSISAQSKATRDHFNQRLSQTMSEFQQEGLNAKSYLTMKFREDMRFAEFPIVPTSAITGEGIPDLLMLAQYITQTQMKTRLATRDELQCTVLEVKVEEGLGVTLDVILVNGVLHVNDTIVIAGVDGPIVRRIRALLTPEPLKELRVRSQWVHHDVIYAAMGCKISAPELDGAIAGAELFVAANEQEVEDASVKVNADVKSVFDLVDKSGNGVFVQASTLGSLEALLAHLKDPAHVPVSAVGIGPVHRKEVLAIAPMVERAPKYAVILAFDVTITPEARQAAQELKVTIFSAPIIYHLTQQYEKFLSEIAEREKNAARSLIVWPVRLKIIAVFNRSKPIILGVRVIDGTLKKGTPLMVVADKPFQLGTVEVIKKDNKDADNLKKGSEVSIQVAPTDASFTAGRDFRTDADLVSKMSRVSIDALKNFFRSDVGKDEWTLIIEIKKILAIQ
jgi:translation initiation factor 5B